MGRTIDRVATHSIHVGGDVGIHPRNANVIHPSLLAVKRDETHAERIDRIANQGGVFTREFERGAGGGDLVPVLVSEEMFDVAVDAEFAG